MHSVIGCMVESHRSTSAHSVSAKEIDCSYAAMSVTAPSTTSRTDGCIPSTIAHRMITVDTLHTIRKSWMQRAGAS